MKILSIKPNANCNHSGLRSRLPFYIINNTLYVDENWYNTWPAFRCAVSKYNGIPVNIIYPNTGDIDRQVYNAIDQLFTVEKYCKFLDRNMVFVPLSTSNRKAIVDACKIYHLTGKIQYNLQDFPVEVINHAIDRFGLDGMVFARSSLCSFKNPEVEPICNVIDLFEQIIRCRGFLSEAERANEYGYEWQLVFSEWVKCSRQYEFRVFVHDGKIRGISQQQWYKEFNWKGVSLQPILDKIAKATNEFVKLSKYNFCTIDVFYLNGECFIIELNPPCLGGFDSGSALFDWNSFNEAETCCLINSSP